MFAEIEQLKLENLHNFYNCKDKSCREFSEGEKARQKLLKKTRMHHKWLKGKDLVYCKTIGIWWLLFSENYPGWQLNLIASALQRFPRQYHHLWLVQDQQNGITECHHQLPVH